MSNDATGEAAFARAYRTANEAIDNLAGTGNRLLVDDLTRATGLSPTPVREALSRLVGEGLIELQRGGGYVVPRLDERDVAEHYSLLQALTHGAIARREGTPTPYRTRHLMPTTLPDALAGRAAYWFERIAVASGNRLIAREMQRMSRRMVGIRRAEADIMVDLGLRLEIAAVLISTEDVAALREWADDYCRSGVALAGAIADWLSMPPRVRI